MNLQGVYTVKLNGQLLAKQHNAIQSDGFKLMQNWFSSTDNQKIKKVNISPYTVFSNGMYLAGFIDAKEVFLGYKKAYYCKTSMAKPYIDVTFTSTNDGEIYWEDKQIVAIGIDSIHLQNDNTKNINTNIDLYATDQHDQSAALFLVQDFTIPIINKQANYIKENYGNKQLVFYLNQPIKASKLRFNFNSHNQYSNDLDCRVYSINIYEKKQQYLPPSVMTLYGNKKDENDKISFSEDNKILTKDIQLVFQNTVENPTNYSVVFKTTLQLDELDSTQQVCAISIDYLLEGQQFQFSHAQFETSWYQQNLTSIQLQYQLFFSNTVALL